MVPVVFSSNAAFGLILLSHEGEKAAIYPLEKKI
jgi:hypothetical protein